MMKFDEIRGENFVVYIEEPDDAYSEQVSRRTQEQQVGAWNISVRFEYNQIYKFKYDFIKSQLYFHQKWNMISYLE